jgi:hypothetical protein
MVVIIVKVKAVIDIVRISSGTAINTLWSVEVLLLVQKANDTSPPSFAHSPGTVMVLPLPLK